MKRNQIDIICKIPSPTYRFADREEGISLKLGNTAYFDNMSQNDMDYRAQKKGATIEEVKEYTKAQILEFSEKDKQAVNESIRSIESVLDKNGYVLPEMDEIIFVKTTMREIAGKVEAYTHKTEIYICDHFIEGLSSDNEAARQRFNSVVCHEIFHCLTRNNPQFKEDMYSIINFKVADDDFGMGPAVREVYYSNPDVDHHNSYIALTINGKKKDCFMVLATSKAFEKEGDLFTNNLNIIFVPVDDTNTYYALGADVNTEEFLSLVGRNTRYMIDPEECMADNFGYAIVYGAAGIEGEAYPTPEIIDNIIDYLKK